MTCAAVIPSAIGICASINTTSNNLNELKNRSVKDILLAVVLHTTNAIEALNSKLRRAVR